MGKKLCLAGLLSLSIFFFNLAVYFVYPDISRLKKENPGKTAFMRLAEKKWREEGRRRKIHWYWAPLSGISPYLVEAVLIAEDDDFWSHEGFNMEEIEKAMKKNIKAKKFQRGASTITQQLARNLYLSPSKNPVRKLKEAILALRLERTLSKRRILEIYLNVAEWGEGVFGIEAASWHYYGKPSLALGPQEAARLASVLPNPKKYNPIKPGKYVKDRSRFICGIMANRGLINETEKKMAALQKPETPAKLNKKNNALPRRRPAARYKSSRPMLAKNVPHRKMPPRAARKKNIPVHIASLPGPDLWEKSKICNIEPAE